MTERQFAYKQLAIFNPEKPFSQESLDNMSVKELRALLRKCNADQKRGELTEQFRDWILINEHKYHNEICAVLKQGNHHVLLVYYGMIFTILKHTGCYFKGKNSNPIEISYSKYCEFFNLDVTLSNNVRKTIAKYDYSRNYLLIAECRAKGEKILIDTAKLRGLESICTLIYHEIKKNIIVKKFWN